MRTTKEARETVRTEGRPVVRPYLRFHFPWFQLPTINHSLSILNGKFQK